MAARDEPLVTRLERQPGQKEARYVDALVPRDLSALPADPAPGEPRVTIADLAREVAALREEVAELRAIVKGD
jgi:uncharacterized protein YceH (UPF0502 family)